MRRMLVSRSSFEKPSPLLRFSRTSSPSRTSTWRWRSWSAVSSARAMVLLPPPESPVSQIVKPGDVLNSILLGVQMTGSRPPPQRAHPCGLGPAHGAERSLQLVAEVGFATHAPRRLENGRRADASEENGDGEIGVQDAGDVGLERRRVGLMHFAQTWGGEGQPIVAA